jgi:hypothetical protein
VSESTIADAPADEDSDARPNITCNRCGTLTTWNPYCPSCGAYLEFGGTPAWHPDEQLSVPPLPGEGLPPADPTLVVSSAAPSGDDSPAASESASAPDPASFTVASTTTSDTEVRHLFTGSLSATEQEISESLHELQEDGQSIAGSIDDESISAWHDFEEERAEAEAELHPHRDGVRPWWASWGDDSQYDESALDQIPDVPAGRVIAAGAPVTEQNDVEGVVFSSRRVIPAPELATPIAELPGLHDDEMQRTRAMAGEEFEADGEACPRCTLINPAGRQYCDWCGTPMPGVLLGPESDAYNPYGLRSTGEVEVPTGPQRSYALKMTLTVLLLAGLAWGIWYLFFGPMADQTRTTMKIVAQQITEWIDPTSGTPAPVSDVDASSSLVGTSPLALKTVNSRDFWASEPMTLYGQGSTISFTFSDSFEIDRMVIYPGIQNETFDVNSLATPRVVTLDFGDDRLFQTDIQYVQDVSLYEQVISFPTVITDSVKVTINEVWNPRYPDPEGSSVGEVAISSIQFLQVPSATTVNPLSTASPSPSPSGSASPSASASSSPGSPDEDSSPDSSPAPSASPSPSAKSSSTASPSPSASPKASAS